MKNKMKILIAHDGSECAEAALADLKRAGMPRYADAIVLSVYEQWIPVPASYGMAETGFPAQILKEEKETLAMAERTAANVKSLFPEWEVHGEANIGSPSRTIIERADEWKPDLVVVGSHGRSAVGRMILGSVSMRVLHSAQWPVRIARGREVDPSKPIRLIVGVDGSEYSEAAVSTISDRHWAHGTEVRIVHGAAAVPPAASPEMLMQISEWIASENERVNEVIGNSNRKLEKAGLRVSTLVKGTDARYLLTKEAEDWDADCIFLGARGMGALERFMLGSVSSSVAARAHCSVEVVSLPF
jgi:nucleotide-binding universal stress UspA family protein